MSVVHATVADEKLPTLAQAGLLPVVQPSPHWYTTLFFLIKSDEHQHVVVNDFFLHAIKTM